METMRFIHLRGQILSAREVESKMRNIFEKFMLFCRRIGGEPRVKDEGLRWSMSCLVPEQLWYRLSITADGDGIAMYASYGVTTVPMIITTEELAPIGTIVEVAPRGKSGGCIIHHFGESRKVRAGCTIIKDVGEQELFKVSMTKDTGLLRISTRETEE